MTESGTDFGIERMTEVAGSSPPEYTLPTSIRNRFPYGLSGIGCLIRNGTEVPKDQQAGWPSVDSKVPRTAVAWSATGQSFFLIAGTSWTWDETVSFLKTELVNLIKAKNPNGMRNLTIHGAMMLDGGASTQFVYRRVPPKGKGDSVTKKIESGRQVPTVVQSYVP